jgi:hypothetical protein
MGLTVSKYNISYYIIDYSLDYIKLELKTDKDIIIINTIDILKLKPINDSYILITSCQEYFFYNNQKLHEIVSKLTSKVEKRKYNTVTRMSTRRSIRMVENIIDKIKN